MTVLETLQQHIGGCREWLPEKADYCWQPTEYVLWGRLIPEEELGPRCYEHAVWHVGHHALRSRSNYAFVNLTDLARDIEDAR